MFVDLFVCRFSFRTLSQCVVSLNDVLGKIKHRIGMRSSL